jgi:hypothetical protein
LPQAQLLCRGKQRALLGQRRQKPGNHLFYDT